MNIVTRIMAVLYWLTGLDQTWWLTFIGGAGGRKFVLALIGFVGIILHNKFGITLTDTEVGALATLIISAIAGISYTDGQAMKAGMPDSSTVRRFLDKQDAKDIARLSMIVLLLAGCLTPRAALAADGGGEVIPSPVPSVLPLSNDEITWVRQQYLNSLVDDAVKNVYTVETDPRSGAITSVKVDEKSKVATLIIVMCCKSREEFEQHRFEAIYKDADAKNKSRVWDGAGEAAFLSHILHDTIKERPEFVQELKTALKETLDAKSKASK